MNVKLAGGSLFFGSRRTEVNRAFPVNVTICKWRPKAYQVRKARLLLAPPGWHDARGKYLRHDDAKWQTMAGLCGAPKGEYAPNHRSFETQNQVGGDDVGGELDCAHSRFRRWPRPRRRPHS